VLEVAAREHLSADSAVFGGCVLEVAARELLQKISKGFIKNPLSYWLEPCTVGSALTRAERACFQISSSTSGCRVIGGKALGSKDQQLLFNLTRDQQAILRISKPASKISKLVDTFSEISTKHRISTSSVTSRKLYEGNYEGGERRGCGRSNVFAHSSTLSRLVARERLGIPSRY
jgi:hypothetical protein